MANDYKKLRERMSAEQLAQAEIRTQEIIAEMLLAEIRKQVGLTQDDLAEAMGIKQPSLSKLESQDDMQISTLRRLIAALGGELELIAHLPGGDIRIKQFAEAS